MCDKCYNILERISVCFFNCMANTYLGEINKFAAIEVVKLHNWKKCKKLIRFFFFISLADVIAFLICSVASGQRTMSTK